MATRTTVIGMGSRQAVVSGPPPASGGLYLTKAGNLADLFDAVEARANLGVEIGVDVQAYDADLAAIAALSSAGLIARTGAGTAAARTITGTANQVSVSNGDGVSGNPTLSTPQNIHTGASPTFAGLSLGTPLTAANGGTGLSSVGSAGQIIRSTGAAFALSTPTFPNAVTANRLLRGSSTNVIGETSNLTWDESTLGVVGNVAIGTGATTRLLDIVGSAANLHVRGSGVTTDSANKETKLGSRHYTNAEEDVMGLYVLSTSANNDVILGGGSSGQNAANRIRFFLGADTTTTTGTESYRFTSSVASFPAVGTTASAANAFLDSGSSPANSLLRSTSSLRHKRVLGALDVEDAANLIDLVEPIRYQSRSTHDNPLTEHVGFAAEQVAKIDDRFVTRRGGAPDWVQYPQFVAPLCLVARDLRARMARVERALNIT